ncbi:MAG: hypothetical protein ACYC0X_25455 [Pirellulaceae bacterium]
MRSAVRRIRFAFPCSIGAWPGVVVTLALWVTSSLLAEEGAVVKRVVRSEEGGPQLLRPEAWQPWQQGFTREGPILVCDNGTDVQVERGASQTISLDQTRPEPVVATAQSRAEQVTGAPDNDYALYLDIVYRDGTHLWGQTAPFGTGTHDWQTRRVIIVPEKPIGMVTMHLLLRRHGGKAWFRDPQLQVLATPPGATRFDAVPVIPLRSPAGGFQVRDVAADSDFVQIDAQALDLKLSCEPTWQGNAEFFDVTLSDTSGHDRAITLLYTLPVAATGLQWLVDPRRSQPVEAGQEYAQTTHFSAVGSNGRLSLYPLGAVASATVGQALGIDMERPAFYRIGYNAATGELFLAYDVGLTPEQPAAHVRFCRFTFDPQQAFRGALARYYDLFPDAFRGRTPEQGLWMPFAKISQVAGWEDFGFKFKEGDNETKWDDEHGMITFRYTEPLTWWMRMPDEVPRTPEAAQAFARRMAEQQKDRQARSLFTSGYRDQEGRLVARMLDTPWCNGAVWSMNSMPGIAGEPTDFSVKWNATLKEQLYGPGRSADLDGEYIDSSEGYVTDELDFCREHFAAADTPLCFCSVTHRPAVFRGLIAFEYVREIARDVHSLDRLMMANSTPSRLCWLAPQLDVLGTETDWHSGGQWQPMSDGELLYRRAMCKGKPFCFLMNTRFEDFSHELVGKYMRRALAYGMFPGFFSHNASEGHYFSRPDLYNRDRDLFRQYVPLCRRVAEAGWEPLTGARCGDEDVCVERFGDRLLTVLNAARESRTVTVQCELPDVQGGRDLVREEDVVWRDGAFTLELGAEDVAVIEVR